MFVTRDDNAEISIETSLTTDVFQVSLDGGQTSAGLTTTAVESTVGSISSVDWVDEKNPPVKVGYDAINPASEV